MSIKKKESTISVIDASKERIKNAFSQGKKIYLSFSGGKDSLVMSDLVYKLILNGEIDKSLLSVVFVDEEAIYPSMVEHVKRWRKRFLKIGVPFYWYCLPFKQVCVLNNLAYDESWITWEHSQKDKWMRDMPEWAITSHPLVTYEGEMNYQTFFTKLCKDGLTMIGLRTSESITRLKTIATKQRVNRQNTVYPIYDWSDKDIWRYIRDQGLEFPEIYMHLYEAGCSKRQLRLCAFFGDCTTQGLRWIAETDPELWERIERRMPNAYLVLLYYDTEMFRRQTEKRKESEAELEKIDYRQAVLDLLCHPEKYNVPKGSINKIKSFRTTFVKMSYAISEKDCQRLYEGILYGDPKSRVMRSVLLSTFSKYCEDKKS